MSEIVKQSVRAKKFEGTNVYEAAVERAKHIFNLHDTVSVSFSGGKDSTATLHVVLEAARQLDRLPVKAHFFDEEAIPYETEEYVRRVAARDDVDLDWYCLPLKENNACSTSSPVWYPWAKEDEDKWVRPMPPEAITEDDVAWWPKEKERRIAHVDGVDLLMYSPDMGVSCTCLGIRAEESLMRYRAVNRRSHAEDNYIVTSVSKRVELPHGLAFKGYPIYDWSTKDVWTAPNKFGWDYNAAYDVMEMAGVNAPSQRCSPPFGTEPLQKLHTYEACFPDIWDRMIDRCPGVAAAARYARTELYGYRGLPPKPPGVHWLAYTRVYLDRQAPEWRARTRKQIRGVLLQHKKVTADPILPDVPHPATGLAWADILQLAMRGDPRNRKQPGMKAATSPARYEQMLERYNAELDRLKETGELKECTLGGS